MILNGPLRIAFFCFLMTGLAGLTPGLIAGDSGDSCVECHSDPGFFVTNKKLYRYYQDWLQSPHRLEDVSCSDCHMGDPSKKTKEAAHRVKNGKSTLTSELGFKDIPETCSGCHDEIYQSFTKSRHFKQLSPSKNSPQGPNCVTCHGSMNIMAVNVASIRNICETCHNPKTKNQPEIPKTAEYLLNKFLAIHRFYRFIGLKGGPAVNKEFLARVNLEHRELSSLWHTFNLADIERKTFELLDKVQSKRKSLSK